MRQRIVGAAYAAGWVLLGWLPEPLAAALFRFGADLAWRRDGPGTRRLRDNLDRVLSWRARRDRTEASPQQLADLTRAALRSYARYWLEVFRLPVLPRERIRARFVLHDEAILSAALARGRGVVAALPHMGNWDLAGSWAVLSGMPFATVAERVQPIRLYDRFVAVRESLGMEVLPLTGGARPPFDMLTDRLRSGRLLCLLADRDLTASGVDVTFFGATARMPAGPAALALRTGSPLLPVTLWYAADGWCGRIHPPVPVPATGSFADRVAAMTQALADVFAAGPDGIAAHPEDWHMLQRLWLEDLAPGDPRRSPRPTRRCSAAAATDRPR